eukprot:427693_1
MTVRIRMCEDTKCTYILYIHEERKGQTKWIRIQTINTHYTHITLQVMICFGFKCFPAKCASKISILGRTSYQNPSVVLCHIGISKEMHKQYLQMRLINHSFILYLFLQCLLQLADAVHKLNTKNTSYTKSKHTCASPHISRFSTSFISPNTPGNAPRNKLIGVVIGWMCCVYCEHVDHLLFARNMCKICSKSFIVMGDQSVGLLLQTLPVWFHDHTSILMVGSNQDPSLDSLVHCFCLSVVVKHNSHCVYVLSPHSFL